MNKIFKVVWSKSKECYVVVSEVAKNNGGKKKVLASVLAGLAMLAAGNANAAVTEYGLGASATGVDATAYGSDAKASGNNSVAVGKNAEATQVNAVAVGRLSKATGTSSVALGVNNKAQADDTTAVGSSNTIAAIATQASAFGRENTINRPGAFAAGYKNTTNGDRNVAVGSENTTTGEDSIGIGTKVIAGTGKTIAIGSVASGDGKYLQTIARGNDTINAATGQVNNIFALAIGNGAQADGKAKSASGMIAIGQEVKADNNNTIAIGVKTEATGNNGTAVGGYAKAIGTSSAAFGTQAIANGIGATAFGPGASAGTGSGAADGSVAVGRKAAATAAGGVGIGWTASASEKNATAIGFSATASGVQSVAIGGGDEYDYPGTERGKHFTTASGKNSVAVGSYAKATEENAIAFGTDANANIAGGVALGSESKTTTVAGVQGYNPADSRTNKYSDQAGAVGTSTLAAVSVGNGLTATRQITGVAAGTADTDAVNVAQLKNVNLKYAGDTGNSDVLLKDGTLKVKGDTNFISTSADATGITVTAKIGDPITANTDGKAVAPTTNGLATTTNVADAINASGWKVTSLNNGGTTNGTTSEKVSPGDTVTFSAGKNIVLDQAGKQFTYSLSSTLKDIESIQNGASKITLNNAGGTTISGGNLSVDGNKITKVAQGTDGTDAVNVDQLNAVAAKERHVKPGNYSVDGSGTVTLNYVDGNNADVADTAVISGIAKDDLSNITNAGKKVITGLGSKVEAGDNVTVTDTTDATTGQKTYTVSANLTKVTDGTNTTVTGAGTTANPYKVNVAGDLTGITSIANTAGGPTMTIGGNSINVTGGNLDLGSNKITNLAPGTISSTSTDAVNGSQLYDVDQKFNNTVKLTGNAGATDGQALNKANGLSFGVIGADNGKYISTSANGSDVTVDLSTDAKKLLNNTVEVKGKNAATVTTSTETTADGGTKTIYTVDVASTGTVAKSSWNIKSSADTANGGAEATGHEAAAKNIADTNTVEMVAGKNLTVKQTSDTDGAKVEYALNKDLKDLTSVTTEKVTTKEIGLQDPTGKVTTIKNDGDRITYTKDGDTKVHKVATLDDEKHIKPGSYAVQNDGSVTMTYVDGNGDPVANTEAKITGIAKQDLSNIDNAGKNVITGLGTIVKAGDNVTVSEASNATTGQKTYTVNAVTPAVYTKADGTKVVKRPDGTYTTNLDGAPGNDVPASDVIVSIQDAAGNTIGGNSIVNNVGSAIDKTGTSTGNTFLNKLDTAANDTPNAAVNVKDLKNTSDAIIGKGLKFDANDGGEKTNKLGSKVTVKGEGTKANTEYSGTNIKTIIAQTGDETTIDVKLAKDLTGINSISNTAAGPKMEFGGNSINITGGNLDLGSNKITNLGPATAGSDAVNYDQLKNSRTEVKSSDGSVTVTPTTAGDKTTYDLKVATTGTVAKSTWNIASDKVSATEGTVAAGSGAAQNIADTKTVTMQAGKNLTVNQTNDGNGNASVAFALDKDLKDLTSVTTEKVTTKEIGLQDPTGKVTTIKNDGDRITYTKDGDTKVHKVATLDDEKHIKPGSYAVQNDGSVTMTYVDGNGDPVANTEAKITGIAKQDLSNIDNAGKNVITGLGTIVKAGDNVTVSEASNATTGQKTYTVNAVTPAVYTKADGTKVVKRPDGTYTTNLDGAPGNDVPASDVIVSIQDAAGNTIGGNSIVNNVGSAIDKTGTSTGNTFLTNLNNAATDNPFAAVNVRDLKSTADALKASELHIAPTSVATGSTEVVGGTASGNTNPGAATQAYKYNATTKQVELTFNDGNGKAVNGPKAVIDFSDLNTGGTAVSSWNIKSSANTTDGGAIGDNHDAAAQNIADNKTVEFQAGKNLVVKQTNDAANGNATVEFSLSDNITAGKDGANGKDGSVGATGKDGSSVVLNGKDGSIGMTGPKGQDGKDGINGRDGADISITSAKGEQVLVNRDPAHNGDTDKAERIVYVPKDANGNPIQGADGKNIVREVATMDDGLRFTGNNTSTENKQKLGSLVKVEGEGVTEAQANSFQSATGNIAVVADGADKLTVKLNKDLKGLDSVTTKEVKLGDANDNISIKKAGDRITYTTPGSTDTHKVATLDDEMHIKDTTYTVDGNKKVTMTYVDGNGNPVAGKTAVIDLSGLPVGETDTDMRIKEGTYTAQNGKVTLNTVDKGGNPVTGKDVVIDGINTNNYVAGDNVTLTPDTDAAGKPVVKINAALSTEKVVKKAGADNLATVSTASGNVAGDKGETYEVAVTKGDIENNAEISYKANGGTAQKTTLANGFNFTSDDNSVAITTGANGKVNFKVDTSGIQGKAFNLDVNKEGTGKVENAQTAAATPSVEKGTKFVAGNNLSIRHDAINGDNKYDHQVTYALNSDLKGINSITNNGGATMNFGSNEVSITGGNLNMGGSKITNVKNGTDKSDVATVGQLTKVTSNDNTVAINKTTDADGAPVYDLSVQGGGHDPRVDQLGEEIGRVGAQGAALAALKPIQYDPLEPTQIMAGYGNYRGNSAIAMGVAHYKNESTLMHAGVSWAGGSRHMMANAGVTWKVGNRDSEAAVADRYRKGPISSAYAMQQEMASVKAQNAGLKTEVSDLKAENEQMKAQIAAMMAKLGM